MVGARGVWDCCVIGVLILFVLISSQSMVGDRGGEEGFDEMVEDREMIDKRVWIRGGSEECMMEDGRYCGNCCERVERGQKTVTWSGSMLENDVWFVFGTDVERDRSDVERDGGLGEVC